ncbi:hypothetical protein EMCRGX_G033820 [Ephydatia muelleri]|eukprot:Em0022g407a
MNTILSRLNAVFAYSVTVLAVLTALCFLSTAFKDRRADSSIDVSASGIQIMLTREHNLIEGSNELANLLLNLKANFSHLFDWNTKQLFVYVLAEYSTDKNPVNQVVLWDKIILRGDSAYLDLSGVKTKYRFFDDGKGLKGNSIKLQVLWNVIPLAGQLPLIGSKSVTVPFPERYLK